MRNSKKKNVRSSYGAQLRKRITRNRRRAVNVGLLYLLATVVFAAAVVVLPFLGMPLLVHNKAPVGVLEAIAKLDFSSINATLANALLYLLIAFILVVNVLRGIFKLGKLCAKIKFTKRGVMVSNAEEADDLNVNVNTMHKLSSIFSCSFSMTLFGYFLIALLCTDLLEKTNGINILLPVVLVVGVVVRLFGGVWGAKTRYFDVVDGSIVEEKREVGRFAPFFRNFLQIASVFVMMYFFLQMNAVKSFVTPVRVIMVSVLNQIQGSASGSALLDMETLDMVTLGAQLLALLCLFVLTKHATGLTEYDMHGVEARGMKNFRVFSFFTFLFMAAAVAIPYLLIEGSELDMNAVYIAAVAFVMFVVELIMRKMPKNPNAVVETEEEEEKEEPAQEGSEIEFPEDVIEAPKSKKEKKAEKKAKKQAKKEKNEAPAADEPVMLVAEEKKEGAAQPMMPVLPTLPTQPAAPGQQYAPMPYPYPFPFPYPMGYYPQSAPQAVKESPVANDDEDVERELSEDFEGSLDEVSANDENTHELDCPICGVKLRINPKKELHRCPACAKVFGVRYTSK